MHGEGMLGVRWLRNIGMGCTTSVELVRGLYRGPYWWLAPVVLLLLPAAVIFVFLQAVPLVAPFVYTIF